MEGSPQMWRPFCARHNFMARRGGEFSGAALWGEEWRRAGFRGRGHYGSGGYFPIPQIVASAKAAIPRVVVRVAFRLPPVDAVESCEP